MTTTESLLRTPACQYSSVYRILRAEMVRQQLQLVSEAARGLAYVLAAAHPALMLSQHAHGTYNTYNAPFPNVI